MSKQIAEHTLRQAAAWHARLAAPACSLEDRHDYQRWRASSELNALAFDHVEAASQRITALMRQDSRLAALADAALEESASQAAPALRRQKWVVAAAASVIVALAGLTFVPELISPQPDAFVYTTAPGERRAVELADGSTVHLDSASEIEVRFDAHERNVTLTSGRAYFKVAKDAERPFAVNAEDVRTTALGTEFEVERASGDVIVTLAEGSVEVAGTVRAAWGEVLAPGEQMRVRGAERQRWQVDLQSVADWSRGRHEFQHTPLADAVTEINRYSPVKLRIGDPSIAQLEIGGSFLVDDSEHIVSAITAALPVRAVAAGTREIILFPRYNAADH